MTLRLTVAGDHMSRPLFLLRVAQLYRVARICECHAYPVPAESLGESALTLRAFAAKRTRPVAKQEVLKPPSVFVSNSHCHSVIWVRDRMRTPIAPGIAAEPEIDALRGAITQAFHLERKRGIQHRCEDKILPVLGSGGWRNGFGRIDMPGAMPLLDFSLAHPASSIGCGTVADRGDCRGPQRTPGATRRMDSIASEAERHSNSIGFRYIVRRLRNSRKNAKKPIKAKIIVVTGDYNTANRVFQRMIDAELPHLSAPRQGAVRGMR